MSRDTHLHGMSESHENYLEAILQLWQQTGEPVRAVDVAATLGISRAAVSKAVHLLHNDGLLRFDEDGRMTLTESGMEIAREILQRHTMLKRFLTDRLGVDPDIAEEEACRMEHAISEDTKTRWMRYMREDGQDDAVSSTKKTRRIT